MSATRVNLLKELTMLSNDDEEFCDQDQKLTQFGHGLSGFLFTATLFSFANEFFLNTRCLCHLKTTIYQNKRKTNMDRNKEIFSLDKHS